MGMLLDVGVLPCVRIGKRVRIRELVCWSRSFDVMPDEQGPERMLARLFQAAEQLKLKSTPD